MAKFTDEILTIFANCLSAVESGGQIYGNGRWNDVTLQYTNSDNEHAITIGAYQRYATEAKALLVRIRKDYPSVFAKYDTAGISGDLDASDWSTYKLPSKTCEKAKAIANIIGSAEGIKIQKDMLGEDAQSYADWIENKYGVHRIDALLHLVNVRHLGGTTPLGRIIGRCSGDVTLEKVRDSLLQDTVRNQVGAEPYRTRQALMYKWLHEKVTPLLNSNGLVEGTGGTTTVTVDLWQKAKQIMGAETDYLEKASNYDLDSKTGNAGYNNYTKYARDVDNWGQPGCQAQPWCAEYQFWINVHLFGIEKALKIMGRGFYNCASVANHAKANGTWHSQPKLGALIIFRNGAHIGRVTAIDNNYVYTNEGNTSSAAGVVANGGAVRNKSYARTSSSIDGYVWIDYGVTSKGYLSKGDTGSDVLAMQEELIFLGYSCGSAGADSDFGDSSEKSLIEFQLDYKLEADGQFGEKSKAKLTEVYNKRFISIKNGVNGLMVTSDTLTVYADQLKTKVVGTLKKGNNLSCDKRTGSGKNSLFHYADGWVSGLHLEGWIKESNKWWYLTDGYRYPVNKTMVIDGCTYYFGISGWMFASKWKWLNGKCYYFTASGSMAKNAYVKYSDHYCWVNNKGEWEEKWDTKTPNLKKYKLVK